MDRVTLHGAGQRGDGDAQGDLCDTCEGQFSIDQGPPISLTTPIVQFGRVTSFRLLDEGDWAVYRADQDLDERFELFGVDAFTAGAEQSDDQTLMVISLPGTG